MKFSSALVALSAFGNIAFAAPVTDGQLQAANQSPSPAGIAQAHLEKRALSCQSIARAIWVTHGVLEAANIFITDIEDYVQGLCERQEVAGCASFITEFRAAFDLALKLTSKVSAGAGIADATASYLNTNARRSLPPSEYDIEALKMLNYSIASHEKVANPRIGARSDDSRPALAHHYRLKGVREHDSDVSRDYEIHHFEDGVAHLHIPLAGSGSTSSVNKRHDGPGVKLAFQHEATGVDPSLLSGCATAVASKWSQYTSQGHANMFGFVEYKNKELMYYRSIMEGKGFGENYEDVMACGDMGHLVGTYLGEPEA
ncbi:hypothetical protein N7517_000916 [Penicillium concentricum]|uniref:Deuterolysin n=1 Tax=Penicillium concentricum TaxID=293559 RepID=A0A9W9VKM9_9EURO|nr:uncharacterized protein N7517_000916 [Penicillium concentricum]KAJ5383005.1 hypothetical protein N7517_000916 [Penicillium concentricum]